MIVYPCIKRNRRSYSNTLPAFVSQSVTLVQAAPGHFGYRLYRKGLRDNRRVLVAARCPIAIGTPLLKISRWQGLFSVSNWASSSRARVMSLVVYVERHLRLCLYGNRAEAVELHSRTGSWPGPGPCAYSCMRVPTRY